MPCDSQRLPKFAPTALARSRFICLPLILTLPFLLAAAKKSTEADDHPVCEAGFLKIVSPDAISVEQCKRVAKLAFEAWNFDLKQLKWKTDSETSLKLRVLSRERWKAEHPKSFGFSRGANLFAVSIGVLEDIQNKSTMAHELGHIQAARATGEGKVPRYFLEAHGRYMALLYREDYLGIKQKENDIGKAEDVARLAAEDAREILTTDTDYFIKDGKIDSKKESRMEDLSLFLIEYVRVHKGIPDALPRMGRVFRLVGQGTPAASFESCASLEFHPTPLEGRLPAWLPARQS